MPLNGGTRVLGMRSSPQPRIRVLPRLESDKRIPRSTKNGSRYAVRCMGLSSRPQYPQATCVAASNDDAKREQEDTGEGRRFSEGEDRNTPWGPSELLRMIWHEGSYRRLELHRLIGDVSAERTRRWRRRCLLH